MPILATGIPVTRLAALRPDPEALYACSQRLWFRDLDGNDLVKWTGVERFVQRGMRGLDEPPLTLITSTQPDVDGALLDDIKVGVRELMLPLFLESRGDEEAFLVARDNVHQLVDFRQVDFKTNDGTFDLVGSSARGERLLRCTYVSGLEGDNSDEAAGLWYEAFPLTLWAVQPNWRGDDWSTPVIRIPSADTWFGTWPGQLSSSVALSKPMAIDIGGDAPSWPKAEVMGPATTVLISAGDGFSLSIPAGLASGEFLTLESDPRRASVLFDGAPSWGRVAADFRTDAFLPGTRVVSIDVAGATGQTYARVHGTNMHRRPW